MTKTRQPNSEYHAASYCVSVLDPEAIAAATGKSVSMLRRASDPDDSAVEIRLCDAARLDAALIRAGHDPKFLAAMQFIIEQVAGTGVAHHPKNLLERLAEATEALGNVASETRAAYDPAGPHGASVSPYECDRLEEAICGAIETLEAKRRDVQAMREAADNVRNIKKEAS